MQEVGSHETGRFDREHSKGNRIETHKLAMVEFPI
jgi:hypothetical protein